jgi:hypothetical protein
MTDLANALNQIGVPLAEAARAQAHIEALPDDQGVTALASLMAKLRAAMRELESESARALSDAYREAAVAQHFSEGSIEIDDDAIVSIGDDRGAYIQAWVWVYEDALPDGVLPDDDEPCIEGHDGPPTYGADGFTTCDACGFTVPTEEWIELFEPDNVACKTCGKTDKPLHIDRNCPDCFVLAPEVP